MTPDALRPTRSIRDHEAEGDLRALVAERFGVDPERLRVKIVVTQDHKPGPPRGDGRLHTGLKLDGAEPPIELHAFMRATLEEALTAFERVPSYRRGRA